MSKLSIITIRKDLAVIAALTMTAVVAPLFGQQLVTGTIVNATLFLAVMLAGLRGAAAVAVVPSLIALAVGTLPAVMAVMVPYINGIKHRAGGNFRAIAPIWLLGGRKHCHFGKVWDFSAVRDGGFNRDHPRQRAIGAGVNDGLATIDYRGTWSYSCLWHKFKIKKSK